MNYHVQKYKHPDLNPSRIKKVHDVVDNILEYLKQHSSTLWALFHWYIDKCSRKWKGDERYVTCRNFRRSCDEKMSWYSIGGTKSCMFFGSNEKNEAGHLFQHEESETM